MADNIEGGMSGSPISADDGSAIGLVSVRGDDRRRYAYCTRPRLYKFCRDGCCANSISLREFVANPLGGWVRHRCPLRKKEMWSGYSVDTHGSYCAGGSLELWTQDPNKRLFWRVPGKI